MDGTHPLPGEAAVLVGCVFRKEDGGAQRKDVREGEAFGSLSKCQFFFLPDSWRISEDVL